MHVVTGRRLVRLAAAVDVERTRWQRRRRRRPRRMIQAVDQDMAEARPRLLAALPVLLDGPRAAVGRTSATCSPGWRPPPGSATTGQLGARLAADRDRVRRADRQRRRRARRPRRRRSRRPHRRRRHRRRRWRRRRAVLAEEAGRSATTSPHCSPQRPWASARRLHRRPRQPDCAWTEEILRRAGGAGHPRRGRHAGAARRPSRRGQDVRTTRCAPSRRRRPASAASAGAGRAPTGRQSGSSGYATGSGTARFALAWRAGAHLDLTELV